MKNAIHKNRVLSYLLILLCCSSTSFSQQNKFKIEPWEKGINKRQPPATVMKSIGFKKDMVVGEIGAGTGRMTMWIADIIGPGGTIYANDIDKDGLDQLEKRAKAAGFGNIKTIVGAIDHPRLPEGKIDIAFMINVFHHLDDPVSLLKNTIPCLKEDGFLAIVDCDPDKTDWGKSHGCTGRDEMEIKLKEAGFKLTKVHDVLQEDGIYIAVPNK